MKRVSLGCGGLLGLGVLGVGGLVLYANVGAKARGDHSSVPMPQLFASTDPAIIEAGRYLVRGPAHCSQCHGAMHHDELDKNTPDIPLTGGMDFDSGPLGITYARNLTPDPETGIGNRTDPELARAIQHGVLGDGTVSIMMNLAASVVSDEDTVAILSYLRSLPPISRPIPASTSTVLLPVFTLLLPIEVDHSPVPKGFAAGAEPSVPRGEYLAENVMLCAGCHSDFSMSTFTTVGPHFAGGMCEPDSSDGTMELCPPNLSNSPVGITGVLDEEAFVARIKHGCVHKGSKMPWENFQEATDSDLRSVYRYIKSQPGSSTDTGPGRRKSGWKAGSPA